MPRIIYSNGRPVEILRTAFLGTIAYEENRTKRIAVPRNLQIPEFRCVLKVETTDRGADAPVLMQEGYLALIRNMYLSFNGRTPRMKLDGRGLNADQWVNQFSAPVLSGLNGGPSVLPTQAGGFEIAFTYTAQIPTIRETGTFYLDTRQDNTDEIYDVELNVDWGNLAHVFTENAASRGIKNVSLDVSYVHSEGEGQVVQGRNGPERVRANQFQFERIGGVINQEGEVTYEIPRVQSSQLVQAYIVATADGLPWRWDGAFKSDTLRINHGSDYILNQPKIEDLRSEANKARGGINMPENIVVLPFYATLDVIGNQVSRSLQNVLPDAALEENLDLTLNVRAPANGKTLADNEHRFDIYLQYATAGNLR